MANLFDYQESDSVQDILIDGIARIEPIADGLLIRVWLYTEEHLAEPVKVIRARLVLSTERALEMNSESGRRILQIHRAANPLKVVL